MIVYETYSYVEGDPEVMPTVAKLGKTYSRSMWDSKKEEFPFQEGILPDFLSKMEFFQITNVSPI